MFDIAQLPIPIVQAPMAGGPATPALASEVSRAGGLGFLAAGYRTAEEVAEGIAGVRQRTSAPFGVNVFVPHPAPDPATIAGYRAELKPEATRYGVWLPEPDPSDDDHWDAKCRLLTENPVPVVSFTFGAPPANMVAALHDAGTYVVATVTGPAEARTVTALGVDALCVQGTEAGGHAGTHDPSAAAPTAPLHELLADVGAVTALPMIAAGGITTGAGIAAAMSAGARAVQLGTAYLRTPESGAKPEHKAALADPRFTETTVTRAFSGRPARGLRNRFIDAHDATSPAGYPLVNQLTKPLRAAAAGAGDPDGLALWAGTGYRDATALPAAELTRRLWAETRNG